MIVCDQLGLIESGAKMEEMLMWWRFDRMKGVCWWRGSSLLLDMRLCGSCVRRMDRSAAFPPQLNPGAGVGAGLPLRSHCCVFSESRQFLV